jgi:hypothetical protein
MISLAVVIYGKFQQLQQMFFQPIWEWDILGFFQLPQSNFSPEGA